VVEVVNNKGEEEAPTRLIRVAWLLFGPSQQLFETFNRKNKIGNNLNQGLSTTINSLHRWLALTKLPPCQPPGEHIPLCAEKEANPLFIFISGKTLFEQYFTEDMGASLSTLGVFIIQIYIFLKNLWTA